ncbi:MAG: short-chain dehydrogenase [Acidimicrobiia bacterium]|nr:short-chain dehydrogenase [Acidimicrobiia bacterium]
MDTTRHTGRTAVVTGAASGIGQAVALRMAQEGAIVIGCDVNEAGLEETASQIKALGGEVSTVRADITQQGDIDHVVEVALERGPVHFLANVAGIMDHFLPVGELDDDVWNRVMAVNLTAPFRLCRAFVGPLEASGGGSIVNVASIAGLLGLTAGAAYTSSKHGLIGLTRSVAAFYGGRNIRCNAVCPGGVATNIIGSSTPQSEWAWERAQVSLARGPQMAEADHIASVVSWLACDEARNVNGAVLAADAGWSAS